MAYRTLTLKIYRPGLRKRRIMDEALDHYARALQYLLDDCRSEVEKLALSGRPVTRAALLALAGGERARRLNDFDAQPFKDSLKIDFAAVMKLYLAQRERSPRAGYPRAWLSSARFDEMLGRLIGAFDAGRVEDTAFARRLDGLVERFGRVHSLYFGRYSFRRDWCLLVDAQSGRYYAKLHLLNAAHRLPGETGGGDLRVVAPGLPPAIPPAGPRRYIVVPLAFGRYQLDTLEQARREPSMLHTARLVRRDGAYYLVVNVETARPAERATRSFLGVARAPAGGLLCSLCGPRGGEGENFTIPPGPASPQRLYILAKALRGRAAAEGAQVILEADGGRRDGAPDGENLLSGAEYERLGAILDYKLPEEGLPPPVRVSANGLFYTCPECGARTRRNRPAPGLFACVECGYATPADYAASMSLARRLIRYRSDRVPLTAVRRGDALVVKNRSLGFTCELPDFDGDYTPVYRALEKLVKTSRFESDPKRYAMLRKLREAAHIRDAVRIVGAVSAGLPGT